VGSVLYAVGGWPSYNAVESYQTGGVWSYMPSLLTGRGVLGVGVASSELYAFGGNNAMDSVEVYTPALSTWRTGPAMPTDRSHFATGSFDDRIYLVGGYHYSPIETALDSVEVFHVASSSWSSAPPLNQARINVASFETIGSRIYAIGGGAPGHWAPLKSAELYHSGSDSWEYIAPLPSARACVATAIVDGSLYAIGGHGYEDYVSSCDHTNSDRKLKTHLPLRAYRLHR